MTPLKKKKRRKKKSYRDSLQVRGTRQEQVAKVNKAEEVRMAELIVGEENALLDIAYLSH